MIKIGIVDYFLDNYHANNYPQWLSDYSHGNVQVVCAYGEMDHPDGGITNREWSERLGIPLCESIEEVVEKSDCIMVLSPSHTEPHEALSKVPLQSGKIVYVDKTFAPDLDAAKRMFALAKANKTPCCSSSALAFVSAYSKLERDKIQTISSLGGGAFYNYAIHQFEPVVALMDAQPASIMFTGDDTYPAFLIKFEDGRIARTEHFGLTPFELHVGYCDGTTERVVAENDVFYNFMHHLVNYFESGQPIATERQTLSVIALLDAAKQAILNPFTQIDIEKIC